MREPTENRATTNVTVFQHQGDSALLAHREVSDVEQAFESCQSLPVLVQRAVAQARGKA